MKQLVLLKHFRKVATVQRVQVSESKSLALSLTNSVISSIWQPSLVFLPGKSHGQRTLVGYNPWGNKELDMTKVT